MLIDPEDGGPVIETKISYVSPVGSADTQSALARAVVANAEQRLRPGLFVTGRVLLAEKPVPLAVKTSALQTHENRTVVFVRNGERFEARPVELGDRDRGSRRGASSACRTARSTRQRTASSSRPRSARDRRP